MKFFRRVKHYVQDSFTELFQKVSWPAWSDLQSSAIVVMVAVTLFSIVVLIVDIVFKATLNGVYSIF